MAWVWTKETGGSRLGQVDDSLRRTYTRQFLVKMSTDTEGPLSVRVAFGVPRIGDAYATGVETDLGALCSRVTPRKMDAPGLWEVDAEYSSIVREPASQNENPLLRPSNIRWGFIKHTKVCERDINGTPIVNSAGVPFDPPIEADDDRPTLTITRNEAAYSPATGLLYQSAVSTDAFFGAAAGVAKCVGIQGQSAYENGLAYAVVTYEFEFRREGWLFRPMDRGRCELVGVDLRAITDKTGMPISEPVPLDGQGRRLQTGSTTLDVLDIDAVSTTFKVADASIFTSAVPFYITIDSEIMEVIFVDEGANQITVVRGQLGTIATPHLFGARVHTPPVYLTFDIHKRLPFAPLGLP